MSEPHHWRYRRLADIAFNLSVEAYEEALYAHENYAQVCRWLSQAMAHLWVMQLAKREILLNLDKP